MFIKNTPIRVLHGQFAGRCGVVLAQVGHAESLLLEIQLRGEPNTTLHRMNALCRVTDSQKG